MGAKRPHNEAAIFSGLMNKQNIKRQREKAK
jgi:hypothetical protein